MTDYQRTEACPFPDECRTGWKYITPCCTAMTVEFEVAGVHWLVGRAVGHGWGKPHVGRIEWINDDGTMVAPDGTETRVRWSQAKEDRVKLRRAAEMAA